MVAATVAIVFLAAAGAASAAVTDERCPPQAQGARCGSVAVPVDRADPAAGQLRIGFELYPARSGGRRLGTVVVVPDGPGISATASRGGLLEAAKPLRNRFAILLIDRRGTGRSEPVRCTRLQRGRGSFRRAIRRCAALLGARADRYGAADVAHDVEAVRAGLGLGALDLYGSAYGAVDVLAYAARYPARVRSMVLASPVNPLRADPWGADQVAAARRAVETFCTRSRSCATRAERSGTLLAQLAQRLRQRPVRANGTARNGRRRAVVIDEAALAEIARNTRGDMVSHGELTGAARALLKDDDPAPLARLAAEASPIAGDRDFGPAGQLISMGAHTAALCTDAATVWERSASLADRQAQYAAARSGLEPSRFSPFAAAGWTAGARDPWDGTFDLIGAATAYRTGPCIDWPAPDRADPVIPAGVGLPRVPTLVLASDTSVHTPLEGTRALAAAIPGASLVEIAGMDHIPAVVEPCVARLAARFLRDLRATGTCAPDPGGPWFAPGLFPQVAGEALPARIDPRGLNRADVAARRAATVAVFAVADAYYHTGSATSRTLGLRGGSVELTFPSPDALIINLDRARYAADIAVTGSVRLSFARNQIFSGRLSLAGSGIGPAAGTVNVGGQFYSRSDRPVRVRGRIGGRRIAALVDIY